MAVLSLCRRAVVVKNVASVTSVLICGSCRLSLWLNLVGVNLWMGMAFAFVVTNRVWRWVLSAG